jgi:hypothetical protein
MDWIKAKLGLVPISRLEAKEEICSRLVGERWKLLEEIEALKVELKQSKGALRGWKQATSIRRVVGGH